MDKSSVAIRKSAPAAAANSVAASLTTAAPRLLEAEVRRLTATLIGECPTGASYRVITAGDWSNAVTALASPGEIEELRQATELTDAERKDYGLSGPLTIFGQPTNPDLPLPPRKRTGGSTHKHTYFYNEL